MIVTPKKDLVQTRGYSKPTTVLTKDKKYIVFAIKETKKKKEYFLAKNGVDDFAYPFPEELFEILDTTLPKEWVVQTEGILKKKTYHTFPEWALEFNTFYYNLSEGLPTAVKIFKKKMQEYGFNDLLREERLQEETRLAKERGYQQPGN